MEWIRRRDDIMDELNDRLMRQLLRDEGSSPHVYNDTLGFATIGVGRLVDARKGGSSGLRPAEINMLLANDIDDRLHGLAVKLPWFSSLDQARQGALVNMAFQLGTNGLMQFTQMLAAMRDGHFDHAASLALDSVWAKQTPERAKRISAQIASGAWQ